MVVFDLSLFFICSEKLSKSGKSSKTSLGSNTCSTVLNNCPTMDLDEIKALLNSGKDGQYLLQNLETSMDIPSANNVVNKNLFHSVLSLPTFIKQDEKVSKQKVVLFFFYFWNFCGLRIIRYLLKLLNN